MQHPDGDANRRPHQQSREKVFFDHDALARPRYLSPPAAAGAGAGAGAGAAAGVGDAAVVVGAGDTAALSEAGLPLVFEPPLRKSVTYQPEPLSAKPAAEIFLKYLLLLHLGQAAMGASASFCMWSFW